VNGRPCRASLKLRAGDTIAVEIPERHDPAVPGPEPIPLAIVFEDDHVLVVDKPAGLVVHPGAGVEHGTLVNALLHHAPGIAGVGGAARPGIVHRLDRDTSGLLVVAKTERAHRRLVEALRRRDVRRGYVAIVWGDPRAEGGAIDAPIARDPRERRRMAVVPRGGRPAVTHWRVAERFGLATRLDVRLETGRTHQIRVHLAHARHPVLGDPRYGGRDKKQLSLAEPQRSLAAELLRGLSRQALHAAELEFAHPETGERRTFTSPLPADLARTLDRLRHAPRREGR
jgi:23S rRNA pseudouridine1911/1915/1917 synthase